MPDIKLDKFLFFDIETVSGMQNFDTLPKSLKEHWGKKAKWIAKEEDLDDERLGELYREKSAIYAEFGKVVCISVGFIYDYGKKMRITSFCDDDEAVVLSEFANLLNNNNSIRNICGHNIREFDVPYICRRMLVHGMELPASLEVRGKKPWEVEHLVDTMKLWKFGDYKNYTSLSLLADLFGIPNPKGDIDGSRVTSVFWGDGDLKRIQKYCEKDVFATANVFLSLMSENTIDESHVEYV